MTINYKYTDILSELRELTKLTDNHAYHGMPFLLYKTAYKLAREGNFAAYFVGQPLYLNYTSAFDNINLYLKMLLSLMEEGELYADKNTLLEQFKSHQKTKLVPKTLTDLKRLGIHNLLVEAIDAADGGIIDMALTDTGSPRIQQIVHPFGQTDHPDAFYTGRILVKDSETPTLVTDSSEIEIHGTNTQTLEIKLGQQILSKLPEMCSQEASVKVLDGFVYIDAPKNHRQTKALNYLLDKASKTPLSTEYTNIEKLINTLCHKKILIETPDVYEYMVLRNQAADMLYGLSSGYIIDSDYTNEPISAMFYTHCLDLAVQSYQIICSETFNLQFEDNDRTSKDAVPNPGADSKTRS